MDLETLGVDQLCSKIFLGIDVEHHCCSSLKPTLAVKGHFSYTMAKCHDHVGIGAFETHPKTVLCKF